MIIELKNKHRLYSVIVHLKHDNKSYKELDFDG